jgi:peptidyl-prolyl cis-trans isomerase C
MNNTISKSRIAVFVIFVFVLVSGCTDNGKNKETSSLPAAGTNQIQNPVPGLSAPNAKTGDIVVSVNGNNFTKSELEKRVNDRMKIIKATIPADRRNEFTDKEKEIEKSLRKQMVEGFITKTLLSEEFAKRKIEANSQDIKMAMDMIAANLPPDKKLTDYLKENGVSNEDIVFAVKLNKFKNMEIGQKAKPTQKEISKFYNENLKTKFIENESVHVRHILVALGKDDSDKVKTQKKERIENLRKQLLNGGNFAELAKKYSDCPSKEFGGDLSYIKRGQMAKSFENAAFSQKKDAIGPVIKTEFGYHIIQVLDHKPAKKVDFEKAKDKISSYLEKGKKIEIFNAVLNKLKEKAKIVIY